MGVPPAVTLRAVEDFVKTQNLRAEGALFNPHEKECVQEAAKLIHADENEIGFLRSTSEGIGLFSAMFNLRAGDGVVLNDLEFMSNVIPWKVMEREKRIRLKVVAHQQGRVLISKIEESIDERTRVIVISSVQEVNGFRCDLAKIGEIARSREIYLVVDAIQQLGALSLDVTRSKVDILIAGGHKWLLSPFGAGIFYVRKELLPTMSPPYVGWANIDPDQWSDLSQLSFSPIRNYSLRNDSAKRFMISVTDIIPGIPALWASLKWLNGIGLQRIEERIGYLTSVLIGELQGSVMIVSPLEDRHRSGIVTIQTQNDEGVIQKLAERRIYVSTAYASGTGGIRIAPHFFNTIDEIAEFCSQLKRLQ
jgi:selenocysteine lyase/cysteine desulfurase